MALFDDQKRKIEEEETYRAQIRGNLVSQTKKKKSRITAAVLAIFLGAIGAHKFYLGRVGWGIIYAVFFWAWIPLILGILEGIIYLFMPEKAFESKYA